MFRRTKSDFHPVVPNIIDETMREADPDVVLVKNTSERKRLQKEIEIENPKPQKNKNSESYLKQDKTSIGRSIVIGILIVVITILVILLIYQLYKLFTTEENPLECPPPPLPPRKPDPVSATYVTPPNKKRLPDNVRDMDIDALSKYINKPASDNINKSRDIIQKTMIEDITPDPKKIEEEKLINDIIDSAMKKDESSHTESEIPSREEETATLKDGLLEDEKERDALFTVAEESMSFLEDFGDDVQEIIESGNESDRSEGGGCQFVLTKGKNKGQVCGNSIYSGDRCTRHEDK